MYFLLFCWQIFLRQEAAPQIFSARLNNKSKNSVNITWTKVTRHAPNWIECVYIKHINSIVTGRNKD
jgi:hypothetical protein